MGLGFVAILGSHADEDDADDDDVNDDENDDDDENSADDDDDDDGASVIGPAGNEAIALINVSAHALSAVSTRQKRSNRSG